MPSGKPTSVYMEDKVMELLEARTSSSASRSEMVNAILYRYDFVCRSNLPAFERAEWLLLIEYLNDTMLRVHPASSPNTLLWLLVEDAFKVGGAAKFGVKREAFTEKVRGFSDVQAVAVFDAVERYRAAKDAGRRPPADIPVR